MKREYCLRTVPRSREQPLGCVAHRLALAQQEINVTCCCVFVCLTLECIFTHLWLPAFREVPVCVLLALHSLAWMLEVATLKLFCLLLTLY